MAQDDIIDRLARADRDLFNRTVKFHGWGLSPEVSIGELAERLEISIEELQGFMEGELHLEDLPEATQVMIEEYLTKTRQLEQRLLDQRREQREARRRTTDQTTSTSRGEVTDSL